MSPSCPRCLNSSTLEPRAWRSEQVAGCPSCGGAWLESGALAQGGGPSSAELSARARLAPGRCVRQGHRVARGMARCPNCKSDAARCPHCSAALAQVVLGAHVVDLCGTCRGAWVEAKDLERFDPAAPPAQADSTSTSWEVPPATDSRRDPWSAPGQSQPLVDGRAVHRPLSCRHCGEALEVASAWAFDGDAYCGRCRPAGAVSGKALPRSDSWPELRASRSALRWRGLGSVWVQLASALMRRLG